MIVRGKTNTFTFQARAWVNGVLTDVTPSSASYTAKDGAGNALTPQTVTLGSPCVFTMAAAADTTGPWVFDWQWAYSGTSYADVEVVPVEPIVGVDSYVSLLDADKVWAYDDTWRAATDDVKAGALWEACRKIQYLPLVGVKSDSTQALAFPRTYHATAVPAYTFPPQSLPYAQWWFEDDGVPQAVKMAQCLEAYALVKAASTGGTGLRAELQQAGVTSISIGGISESYGNAAATANSTLTLTSEEAFAVMEPYIAGAVRLV